MKASRRRSSL